MNIILFAEPLMFTSGYKCDRLRYLQEASQGSVEMYIASADLPLPLKLQSVPESEGRQRLRVAPPRHQRAVAQQEGMDAASSLQQWMPTDASRALRKELGVTKANLQSKTAELGQAKRAIKCERLTS